MPHRRNKQGGSTSVRSQIRQHTLFPEDRDPTGFLERLGRLPPGYSEVIYAGRRWGVSLKRSVDNGRVSLLARELGGRGLVSFNLYATSAGAQLKPCEMPEAAVTRFILGFTPITAGN